MEEKVRSIKALEIRPKQNKEAQKGNLAKSDECDE